MKIRKYIAQDQLFWPLREGLFVDAPCAHRAVAVAKQYGMVAPIVCLADKEAQQEAYRKIRALDRKLAGEQA